MTIVTNGVSDCSLKGLLKRLNNANYVMPLHSFAYRDNTYTAVACITQNIVLSGLPLSFYLPAVPLTGANCFQDTTTFIANFLVEYYIRNRFQS